jgi:hypothetical protein
MLRLKNLSNKYQKRTCRPLYANTQATPYAATLYNVPGTTAGFRTAAGKLQIPTATVANNGLSVDTGSSLMPGTVLVRIRGTEQVTVATGAANEVPFGLLANFVGGDLDEGFSGDSLQNSVGVWRGPDSVFEILAPAFGTITIADGLSGGTIAQDYTGTSDTNSSTLYAGTNGLLTNVKGSSTIAVARLIEKVGSSRIIVDLAV